MAGNTIIDVHAARKIYPTEVFKPSKDASDIVTYVRKNKVKKVGEGDEDFVIEEVIVEESRVNRQAFIAKDSRDVGVMNILEKVRRSGDLSLLNQVGRPSMPSHEVDSLGRPLEDVVDITGAPSSVAQALSSVEKGSKSFEALRAIFGDVSFEQLANMSESDILGKLQAYADKVAPKTTVKDGDK